MNLQYQETEAFLQALQVCRLIRDNGGRAFFVGGSVRDRILHRAVSEFDIEAYGLEPGKLIQTLRTKFRTDLVGKTFGVIKLRDIPVDVSIPRRETKSGEGHRDFTIDSDAFMAPTQACLRRDFTVNAIMYDPLTGELVDPLGGCRDIQQRILRHCSAQFAEDPLRALRGMRFSAMFQLTPAAETLREVRQIDIRPLTKTRIFDEWRKMLLQADRISFGLEFLRLSGLDRFYPELKRLQGCPQDPIYHPEGSVWNHTKLCLDAFAAFRLADPAEALIAGLAVLCHDLGKPDTTKFKMINRVSSKRHELIGEDVARLFLSRITDSETIIRRVLPLVRHHMQPYNLYVNNNPLSSVRRLAHKVGSIKLMAAVVAADHNGRGDRPKARVPEAAYLVSMAQELALLDKRPVPLVKGRHLIAEGLKPGKQFADILAVCFEAQLNGDFTTEADGVLFLRNYLQPSAAADSLNSNGGAST